VLIVLPQYADATDFPVFLDMVVIDGAGVEAVRFRNRYDVAIEVDDLVLDAHLDGATNAQIGRLGEETAAIWIEARLGGTLVALGDTGMRRTLGRQDLDVLAIVDDTLVAFEVKTRFHSRYAGRLTRAGDLYRPQLRRAIGAAGHPQGSQPYVAERLGDHVDIDDEHYRGIDVRVVAVDLVSFLIQQFAADDAGRKLRSLAPPVSCRGEAEAAVIQILEHRGHL
jgi:Holliday junction resolvase-like predicted endonuclease